MSSRGGCQRRCVNELGERGRPPHSEFRSHEDRSSQDCKTHIRGMNSNSVDRRLGKPERKPRAQRGAVPRPRARRLLPRRAPSSPSCPRRCPRFLGGKSKPQTKNRKLGGHNSGQNRASSGLVRLPRASLADLAARAPHARRPMPLLPQQDRYRQSISTNLAGPPARVC